MNKYKLLKLLTDNTNPSFTHLMTDVTGDLHEEAQVAALMRGNRELSDQHLAAMQHALTNGTHDAEFGDRLREVQGLLTTLFSYLEPTEIVKDEFDEFDDLLDDDEVIPVINDDLVAMVESSNPDEVVQPNSLTSDAKRQTLGQPRPVAEPADEFSDIFGSSDDGLVTKEAGDPFDRSTVSAKIDEPGPWDEVGDLPPMQEGDSNIDGTFEDVDD